MKVNDFKPTTTMGKNTANVCKHIARASEGVKRRAFWELLPNHDFVIFGTSRLTYNNEGMSMASSPARQSHTINTTNQLGKKEEDGEEKSSSRMTEATTHRTGSTLTHWLSR